MGGFPKVLNFDRLFPKLNRFIYNYTDHPNYCVLLFGDTML